MSLGKQCDWCELDTLPNAECLGRGTSQPQYYTLFAVTLSLCSKADSQLFFISKHK